MTTKPIISNISPIDIKNETKISFEYSGNPIVKNKLTLYVASTQTMIWQDIFVSPEHYHIIPANLNNIIGDKWYNGSKYALEITIYDETDNPCISDKVYFYTYSTPIFRFSGLVPGTSGTPTVINDNEIKLVLDYEQDEGESLNEYRFYIYENSLTDYTATDIFTTSTSEKNKHYYFTYTYKKLDKTLYYFRATGITKRGIVLDTGMYAVKFNYPSTEGYSVMLLSSDDNATITGDTNFITIDPNEKIEDGYIVINSEVQLLDKSLTYEQNYKIQRDFTLSLKMSRTKIYSPTPTTILVMRNGAHIITLTSYVYDDDALRYHLIIDNGICTNNHYTNPLYVSNNESVIVHIRRIDNLYHIEALVAD